MLHAHLAATRCTCDRGPELFFDPGRHGVGAVIVRDHRIIAGGYAGSPPGQPHCNVYRCGKCSYERSRGADRDVHKVKDRSRGAALVAEVEREPGLVFECPNCGSRLEGGHLLVDGHCVRTLHAEENALLQCAIDGVSPAGATLYTSASPCWDCTKRALRVGIHRIVFSEPYGSRYGLSADALKMLQKVGVSSASIPPDELREILGVGPQG